MVDDFLGWLIFSVILGMMGENVSFSGIVINAGYTLAFAILMITLGKRIFNLILPKINQYFSWPGGIMGVTIALAFFAAALTEHLGIHAIFGAFIMGVSLGESEHMNAKVREIIHVFVTNIFAPVFFVSIGLKVSFTEHFNPVLCLLVLVLAMAGKLIGCTLAARSSGYPWSESLVVGFGMNARGAMEIILASLALQAGLIREDMFVALVIMALVTSMTSGPMMRWILKLTGSDLLQPEGSTGSA
jgi:Kef-type K+ transport system membrane component KefB